MAKTTPPALAATAPASYEDALAELERLVGRQALQLDMAKKVFGSSDFLLKGDE